MRKLLFIVLGGCFHLLIVSMCFAAFSPMFATSDECSFCHTSNSSTLVDSEGNDLSIADDWSSTMMGNSFRDPLFRAKIESEVVRNPQHAGLIEDKCLTCHTPMARTQKISGSTGGYALAEAENSTFAEDGVSCTLCHQIQNGNLGNEQSFSGNYLINNDRKIFGPYRQVFANPMINHVNYLPLYGEQADRPELCATCHTLFTPYFDNNGNIAGEFPEQTPYLEWLNSSYASPKEYQSCQDCHMPRIDEPVKITNRPPWYRVKQSPFWKHHFTGGNTFVLEMMKNNREMLGISVSAIQFEKTLERTKTRLRNESAEISFKQISRKNNRLLIPVSITNKAGHKFPTGFPSRRAWVHIEIVDSQNRLIFESGKFNSNGEITGHDSAFEPHYDLIESPDKVQIYQAVMSDMSGKQTYTLLHGTKYLKDNRLPPEGYQSKGPMVEFTAPAGEVVNDRNFNVVDNMEGSGTDVVTYAVSVADASFPLTITAQLLYQSSSPQFIENLLMDDTPTISRFKNIYASTPNTPVIIGSANIEWDN